MPKFATSSITNKKSSRKSGAFGWVGECPALVAVAVLVPKLIADGTGTVNEVSGGFQIL